MDTEKRAPGQDAVDEANDLAAFAKSVLNETGLSKESTTEEPKKEPKDETVKESTEAPKKEVPKKDDVEITLDDDEDLEGLSPFSKLKLVKKETTEDTTASGTTLETTQEKTGDPLLDSILEKVELSDKVQLSTKEAFAAVKKAAKVTQEKLQKELEAARKSVEGKVESKEMETIRKENDELKKAQDDVESKLAILDVRNSRQYKSLVTDQLDVVKTAVDELATKYSVEAPVLRSVVDPNVPYDEFLQVVNEANINEEDKDTLKDYRKSLKTVLRNREDLEKNAKETKERLEAETKQQQEQFNLERSKLLVEAKSIFKDKILLDLGDHFQELEGQGADVDAWNGVVKGFHKTVESIDPASLDIEKQGMLAAMAAAFPVMLARLQIFEKDNTILQNKLRKLRSANSTASSAVASGVESKGKDDSELPLEEWVGKILPKR
jgi:hypothetical protein